MDSRRQHHGTQQFPPLLQSQGGGPPRQHLPLPPPHLAIGGARPSPFSGGPAPPLSGHKRSSMALYNRSADGPNFAKVFVGSLPRNISEEKVRELFNEFGNVVEVFLLKDKKTGLSQGCCFVKFSSVVEAERAVRALDNRLNLPGSSEPLQVKFADGDRDHPGLQEHKLFVGAVSRQANEQDIEEIFSPYGQVENVYVIRNEHKQSRGCAFVSFPEREMAIAAISALDGVYRMAGCHQPLIVRFADPKRPRSGEARLGHTGTNYSPHSSGAPRGSGGQSFRAQSPGYGWRQGGGSSGLGLLPQTGILPLGGRGARGGPLEGPNATADGRAGVGGVPASPIMSSQLGFSGSSSLSQPQGVNESSLQRPVQTYGHQLPLHQQAMQPNLSSIPHHNQMQPVQGIPFTQPTDKRVQQLVSPGQFSPAQQTAQPYGPPSISHHQPQQQVVTSMQQGLPAQQLAWQQPLHQQISQPIQQPVMMPLQQGQQQILPLQSRPSQPQQQVLAKEQPLPSQLTQQVAVKETVQQAYVQPQQMTSQQPVSGNVQPSWSIPVQQPVITPQTAPAIAVAVTPAPVLVTCDWTEHTSPEGHKYYYNSSTGESRWEKPVEFIAFEKQRLMQQQLLQQQQQPLLHQQQEVHAQAQSHVQQLQPQMLNQQLQQQQQLSNQQPQQQAIQQPYAQNVQPYHQQQQLHMQQIPQHQLQLQQPQVQQLQQQPPPQQQPSAQQHQAPLLQQAQRETQLPAAGIPSLHFGQPTSGGSYQPVQGYTQMQHQMHQLPQGQQAPSANGTPDLARGAQWIPTAHQVTPL